MVEWVRISAQQWAKIKDVKNGTNCCYGSGTKIVRTRGEKPWLKNGRNSQNKGRAIKELDVCRMFHHKIKHIIARLDLRFIKITP